MFKYILMVFLFVSPCFGEQTDQEPGFLPVFKDKTKQAEFDFCQKQHEEMIKHEDKQLEKYIKGCNEGKAAHCSIIGNFLLGRPGGKAKEYLEKACNLQSKTDCAILGRLEMKTMNYEGALKYFKKACDKGYCGPLKRFERAAKSYCAKIPDEPTSSTDGPEAPQESRSSQ